MALAIGFALFLPPIALAQQEEPQEVATRVAGGLEITLVVAPPLTEEQMAKMMEAMEARESRKGMEGMPMPGMTPTHYLGVIITDQKTGKVVKGLSVTLTAKGQGVVRKRSFVQMPGSYAHNISLPAKGMYRITIKIEGFPLKKPLVVPFDFEYK